MDLLKADVAAFSGNGTWWNPSEPGTGFFFEGQGGTGVVTFYVFESSGRPTWVSAAGTLTATTTGHTFQGTLQRYTGGLPITANWQPMPVATPVGPVTIRFASDTAEVTLPKRSFTARKCWIAAPGSGLQPETGIYWNPAESGRGYVIEVNADVATVGAFLYTADGQPTWSLVTVPMPGGSGSNATGDYVVYSGGQTLSGAYRAPSGSTNLGKLSFNFNAACAGQIGFPGMPAVAVQRYGFGGLPNGGECRSKTVTSVLPGY